MTLPDDDLRAAFQRLKTQDAAMVPPVPDFEILAAQSRRPTFARYASLGGLAAACIAVVLVFNNNNTAPIDPETWQVAELPQWAASTDTLLLISDRALPASAGFEPLNIKATFGRSLTLGKGQ